MGDWYTTRTALAKGAAEANPVIRWLMKLVGINGALVAKGLFVIACGYVVITISWWWVAILCAMYAAVVWHNWRVIRKLSR